MFKRSNSLDRSILLCPRCKSGDIEFTRDSNRCLQCGAVYEVLGGVHDLRLDPDIDTALDLDTYDANHSVNTDHSKSVYAIYDQAFALNPSGRTGRVLEIGSGTGNLTIALARHGQFSEIHCSDISLRFMRRLEEKIGKETGNSLHRYLFDANFFPFKTGSFDYVVGHSILHHLLHFERTLEDAHRVLKDGGIAVFGEPMMETYALVYLVADQIIRVDGMLPESKLSPITKTVLTRIATWGELKTRNLNHRDEATAAMEDKFVPSAAYLRETAKKIGFSDFHLIQYAPVSDLGAVIEKELHRILSGTNAIAEETYFFRPLMQSFSSSYQKSMDRFTSQAFAFCALVK